MGCCSSSPRRDSRTIPEKLPSQGPHAFIVMSAAGDSRLPEGMILKKAVDPKSFWHGPCWRSVDSKGNYVRGPEAITLCFLDDTGGHENIWAFCAGWEVGPNHGTSMPAQAVSTGEPTMGCLYITRPVIESVEWSPPPLSGYRRVLFCDAPISYTGESFRPGGVEPAPVLQIWSPDSDVDYG